MFPYPDEASRGFVTRIPAVEVAAQEKEEGS
jgi:hypothetical protein